MKPTLSRQLLGLGAITMFVGVATILLFSDRAASAFDDLVRFIKRTSGLIENRLGIDWIDRSDIPAEPDQVGHFLLWAVGMFIAGWVLRRRVPVPITALFVGGISMLSEVMQPLLSSSRGLQPGDAIANLLGITVAALTLSLGLAVMRWYFGDDRSYHGDQIHYEEEPTDEYFLQ